MFSSNYQELNELEQAVTVDTVSFSLFQFKEFVITSISDDVKGKQFIFMQFAERSKNTI
jgi:hypothetical protein